MLFYSALADLMGGGSQRPPQRWQQADTVIPGAGLESDTARALAQPPVLRFEQSLSGAGGNGPLVPVLILLALGVMALERLHAVLARLRGPARAV